MKEFGLIGRTLGHSFSADHFASKFEREGLTDCRYERFELAEIGELPTLMAEHPHLVGFNVTIPYKQAVIPYLDDLSQEAREVGAVNCVKREGERWVGYNTDIIGFEGSLCDFLEEYPERALVLGTGGASQAVQYVLARLGIAYELISRDPARGNYTYDNLPCEVIQAARLIVNASPVGTRPRVEEAPRIPYAFLSPDHYLFDLVYNPPLTAFLEYGTQRGARIRNGEQMLHLQAEAAWEIWNR